MLVEHPDYGQLLRRARKRKVRGGLGGELGVEGAEILYDSIYNIDQYSLYCNIVRFATAKHIFL